MRKTVCRVGCLMLMASSLLVGCGQSFSSFGANSQVTAQAKAKRFVTPAWVKDAVFYQIFPERFYNGNTTNDPENTQDWSGKPENFNFFGGDLQGVIAKLPHLKSLGVNAIYFNPVFASASNHKYDTSDYMKIDPHFGDEATFKQLIQTAHSNGIKVIIDGVFNHTGDQHFAFQDAMKNGPTSKYWKWYNFYGFPVVQTPKPNYDSWWGFGTLPKLQVAQNPEVANYLIDTVVDHWTRAGVDGWRLDVPNEIPSDDFWRRFRNKVKSINPNAYICGEIWEDGSHWLQGDQFDSVMNYVFRKNALNFFAYDKINADQFDSQMQDLRNHYDSNVTNVMFNLLGSHDTPRVLNECGNDLDKLKLLALFQMTYPGAPVVYYGDEIGMTGGMDPDCRRPMSWNKINSNLFSYYKKLIAARKENSALRTGDWKTLLRHNDYGQIVYRRSDSKSECIVFLNKHQQPSITLSTNGHNLAGVSIQDGTAYTDALTGRKYTVTQGKLTVSVPSSGGALLVKD